MIIFYKWEFCWFLRCMKSLLQEKAQLRKIKNFCNMKDEIWYRKNSSSFLRNVLSRSLFPFLKERVLHSKNVCMFVCPSQSETSFFILRLFELLMKPCCRLWRARNPNLRSDFPSELPIGWKVDQLETSFFGLRLSGLLMKLCYSLFWKQESYIRIMYVCLSVQANQNAGERSKFNSLSWWWCGWVGR